MLGELETLVSEYTKGNNPRKALNIDDMAKGLTAFYLNASALLDDSWFLAESGRLPRAVALLVLAIEELAKIPKLHDHYISLSLQNLPKKELTKPWQDFWKAFSRHGEKQKTIKNYGKGLRDREKGVFINQHVPYSEFLNEETSEKLDRLKQRCLYVDYIDSGFIEPSKVSSMALFDELYTFALERLYSFGALHGTECRSKNMLESALAFIEKTTSDSLTQEEFEVAVKSYRDIRSRPASKDYELVKLDVIYWSSHRSSSVVPDYVSFRDRMAYFTKDLDKSGLYQVLAEVLSYIKPYIEQDRFPNLAVRHFQMFKLILSFSNDALQKNLIKPSHYERLFPKQHINE